MASARYTAPYKDIRHAVGALADILDLALQQLKAPSFTAWEKVHNVIRTRDVAYRFAKASKKVCNGAKRKGFAKIYQDACRIDLMVPTPCDGNLSIKTLCVIDKGFSMAISLRNLIVDYMEDANKVADRLNEALIWRDYVANARQFGVKDYDIAKCEIAWRWRDLTGRKHRGPNMRAAFEAAWLIGAHAFAIKMLDEKP